jgi:transcriptional antiterminator NusG
VSTPPTDPQPGDLVEVLDGPFVHFIGVIDTVDVERRKLRATVSFFGRAAPLELDFSQVARYEPVWREGDDGEG